MRAWRGPDDALVPLVGYLGGATRITDLHTAPTSYPVVEATSTYHADSELDSHPVTLPTGITAGDLLLLFLTLPRMAGSNIDLPSGWSSLYADNYATGSSYTKVRGIYKTASGSEGGTVTVATPGLARFASVGLRISGWQGTPEAGTAAKAASANPNPPSLSPSWGSDKTLWLAVAHSSAADAVSSYPSSYTDGLTIYTGVFNEYHARATAARRELEASSDDPGTFTLAQSVDWVANTVAVRGA